MWAVEQDWVAHTRTAAVFLIVLMILWLARTVHFKFGQLEATVVKTEKQLNGRIDGGPTVSSDVMQIRAMVEAQSKQMTDVHANIIVADGQRDAMRQAMTLNVSATEALAMRLLATDRRVDNMEQRLNAPSLTVTDVSETLNKDGSAEAS